MTGYGKCCLIEGDLQAEVEIRSVNHRFMEVTPRIPRMLFSVEHRIKEKVREYCHRGKIDLYLTLSRQEGSLREMEIDMEMALSLWRSMERLAQRLGLRERPPLGSLLSRPEIYYPRERKVDMDSLWGFLERALETSLQQLVSFREKEGGKLKEELKEMLKVGQDIVESTARITPKLPQIYKDKLERQLKDLELEVPPERLAQEVVLISEKMDIAEELVRLKSHIEQFRDTLEQGSPAGKKLDFIAQEMLREANTIASKSPNAEIIHLIVELKNEIEKIREQVQNIE